MKDGKKAVELRSVNWPKGLFVTGLVPPGLDGLNGKSKLRALLARHRIPAGVEGKYFNTVAFFDHIYDEQELAKFERPAEPSPPADDAGGLTLRP